jgi:hypothetical protein
MAFRFLQWLSEFLLTVFRFSSTAFRFPRNPRKSIYGEKYTKFRYSSFVFFATRSPSFVIPAKQYLRLTQQMLLNIHPNLSHLSTRPISIFFHASKNMQWKSSVSLMLCTRASIAIAFCFLVTPWAFCNSSVLSIMLYSLLGSFLLELGVSASLIPLTPAHDLNLMSQMTNIASLFPLNLGSLDTFPLSLELILLSTILLIPFIEKTLFAIQILEYVGSHRSWMVDYQQFIC